METTSFTYQYSAQESREVEAIRKKYLPKEMDKMARLRRLDASVTNTAQAVSLAFGVLGTLILGLGMSLCMTELGAALGRYAMILGIMIGLVGIVLVAIAYPIYIRTLKKERERIAPEILRISDELLK